MSHGSRGASAPLAVSAAIALAALIAMAGLGTVRWLRSERAAAVRDASFTVMFDEAPIVNRREAWFRIGSLDVGVVEARPLADGRLGFRVLVLSQDGTGACCTLESPGAEIASRPGFETGSVAEGSAAVTPRLEEFTIAASPGGSIVVDVVDLVSNRSTGTFSIELDDLRMPADPWAQLVP